MIKYLATMVATMVISSAAFATPINLGDAGNYTLLATESESNGVLGLGASAHVDGNVGAARHLSLGSSATVAGDADYATVLKGAGASIVGTQTSKNAPYWHGLYADLQSASGTAGQMSANGTFENNTFASQGALSVFDINGLDLGANAVLSFDGNAGDEFIINIDGTVNLGAGVSFDLGSVSADDVLFNILGSGGDVLTVGSSSTLFGTFLMPNGSFNLGSGSNLDGTRLLALGGLVGSSATITGLGPSVPHVVPEPGAFALFGLALFGIGITLNRRRTRYS